MANMAEQAVGQAALAGTERGGKFLTFVLSDEEYGVDILCVREIIGIMDITTVPQTPQFVKGVINLRGKIIPVIDLRLKFDMPEKPTDKETCIIVVETKDTLMGVMVDTVSEVMDIESSQIEAAPSFGTQIDTSFIRGMGKVNSKVKILLDIEKVLSSEELVLVHKIAEE